LIVETHDVKLVPQSYFIFSEWKPNQLFHV
jgi:hypothetical protein